MKKKKKNIGITLIFACRDGKILKAEKKDFLIKANNPKDVQQNTDRIGFRQQVKLKRDYDYCKYLGMHDIFEVNGPVTNGAIMGRTTFWSYKNLTAAKRLLRLKKSFGIYNYKHPIEGKHYIAEMVYFLGYPETYVHRRTLACHVLVESRTKKGAIKNAVRIGKSDSLIAKVKQVLLQYEHNILGTLKFVGLADVRPIPEKIAVGNCFGMTYKKFKNMASIRRLIMSRFKITEFFRSR